MEAGRVFFIIYKEQQIKNNDGNYFTVDSEGHSNVRTAHLVYLCSFSVSWKMNFNPQ